MCGRFALATDSKTLEKHFNVPQMILEIAPKYNIAPQSFIPVIYGAPDLKIREMKWGFVPSWSREPKVKFANFNARSETVMTSSAYRSSFANKRCLVPATGFYEWQIQDDGTKKPLYIHSSQHTLFAIAGLYDIWTDVEGKEFWSCTLLTREANNYMKPIHDRMPVILEKEMYVPWLENSSTIHEKLEMIQESSAYPLIAEDGEILLTK